MYTDAYARIADTIRHSEQSNNPQGLGWEIAQVLIDDFGQTDLDEWDVVGVVEANPGISPEDLAKVILAELELDSLT